MNERCPFVNDIAQPCPAQADVIAISGTCEIGAQGERCGPVISYAWLVHQYHNLQVEDAAIPIEGTFTIQSIPDGPQPLGVREAWVGVDVPIRNLPGIDANHIGVIHIDAVLSLLRAGKVSAAEWFVSAGWDLGPLQPTWIFERDQGDLKDHEVISSSRFYGDPLGTAIKNLIELA